MRKRAPSTRRRRSITTRTRLRDSTKTSTSSRQRFDDRQAVEEDGHQEVRREVLAAAQQELQQHEHHQRTDGGEQDLTGVVAEGTGSHRGRGAIVACEPHPAQSVDPSGSPVLVSLLPSARTPGVHARVLPGADPGRAARGFACARGGTRVPRGPRGGHVGQRRRARAGPRAGARGRPPGRPAEGQRDRRLPLRRPGPPGTAADRTAGGGEGSALAPVGLGAPHRALRRALRRGQVRAREPGRPRGTGADHGRPRRGQRPQAGGRAARRRGGARAGVHDRRRQGPGAGAAADRQADRRRVRADGARPRCGHRGAHRRPGRRRPRRAKPRRPKLRRPRPRPPRRQRLRRPPSSGWRRRRRRVGSGRGSPWERWRSPAPCSRCSHRGADARRCAPPANGRSTTRSRPVAPASPRTSHSPRAGRRTTRSSPSCPRRC